VPDLRVTKRVVDRLMPRAAEFTVWDSKLPGFGVRVRPTGAKSFVVVYRAGSGRGAPVRRYTTGATLHDCKRRQDRTREGPKARAGNPRGSGARTRSSERQGN
jgi:hypothetical protein